LHVFPANGDNHAEADVTVAVTTVRSVHAALVVETPP